MGRFLKSRRKVSATLIRKSLLTFVYDNNPEMKEELANLRKHNLSITLSKLRKECAATAEKIDEALFGEYKEDKNTTSENENEKQTRTEEQDNESDPDYNDDDDIPEYKKQRKCWSKIEQTTLLELLGETKYENWYLPLIRQVSNDSNNLI